MSPGKCSSSPTMNPRRSPSPAAARFLTFGIPKLAPFSWADRVRGFSNTVPEKQIKDISVQTGKNKTTENINKGSYPSPVHEASIEAPKTVTSKTNDDEEGWEIVTKGRSRSKGSNLSATSSGSSNPRKDTNNVLTSAQDKQKATTPIKTIADATSILISSENKQDISNIDVAKDTLSDTDANTRIENLSRSSTIIEEYLNCNINTDVSDTLMHSSSSLNFDSVDLVFGLTESELQIKEEQEMVSISFLTNDKINFKFYLMIRNF